MSVNDGTGINWNEAEPTVDSFVHDGATEIQDLRKGVDIRASKEHKAYADDSVGGEHLLGSAVAYYGSAYPGLRPDGVTNLDTDDTGRIFVETNGVPHLWDGTQWTFLMILNPAQVGPQAIDGTNLVDHSVSALQIVANSLTNAEMADGSIATTNILDGNVTTAKIADSAITATQIADATITAAKMAGGVLPNFQMAKGTYTGNGTSSNTVTVGFEADFIFIFDLRNNNVLSALGYVTQPTHLQLIGGDPAVWPVTVQINILTTTFVVMSNATACNQVAIPYYWLAIKLT